MALTCPRCGTDVPTEALYCPYCSLPKPKRGFVAAEEKPVETQPELPRPVPVYSAPNRTKKGGSARPAKPAASKTEKKPAPGSYTTAKLPTKQPRKRTRSRRASIYSVAALVALMGVGAYIFVVPMVYSERAEPKVVLAALDKLRKSPSSEPGVTIDARLARELETTKRVGNLVSYQGWVVRPIKGTKTRVVLAFAFEEVGNNSQSAEWLADLAAGTFTPQTDLATTVSSR
jgi:hypothetical protein